MQSTIQDVLTEFKAVLVAGWTAATGGFSIAVVVDGIELAGAVVAIVFAALINYAIWRKAKGEAELIELKISDHKRRIGDEDEP